MQLTKHQLLEIANLSLRMQKSIAQRENKHAADLMLDVLRVAYLKSLYKTAMVVYTEENMINNVPLLTSDELSRWYNKHMIKIQ